MGKSLVQRDAGSEALFGAVNEKLPGVGDIEALDAAEKIVKLVEFAFRCQMAWEPASELLEHSIQRRVNFQPTAFTTHYALEHEVVGLEIERSAQAGRQSG